MEEEIEISCPYCGESITVLVDPFVTEQNYIEDCSVCCRPIQINVTSEDGAVSSISADRS